MNYLYHLKHAFYVGFFLWGIQGFTQSNSSEKPLNSYENTSDNNYYEEGSSATPTISPVNTEEYPTKAPRDALPYDSQNEEGSAYPANDEAGSYPDTTYEDNYYEE